MSTIIMIGVDGDLAEVWDAESIDGAVIVGSHLRPIAPSNLPITIVIERK